MNNFGRVNITINKIYDNDTISNIDKEVTRIYNELINDNMSDEEKIKVIHDYIINHTDYDEQRASEIKNNLYSANLDDIVIVNSLYKSFAAMGYDFDREKFDLSQKDYYQQASNILNARKDENLREAKEILADSRLTNLSDEMEKRKENLLNQIALLELDSEETVSVNIAETLEELAERIKTEKADRAVQNKKIEEANRSLQEKLQQSEAPYCAVYAQ